jgi:hypothetical protein
LLDEITVRGKSQDPMLAAMGLAIRVEAVLALHVEEEWENLLGGPPAKTGRCDDCDQHWPCPTRRALEGEK